MKVEMTFDDAAIEALGHQRADVARTLQSAFGRRGLRCTSDGEVLTFADAGHEGDYAQMWQVIFALLRSDWFIACAKSCTFFDDDDSEEDVLSQAWKVRRRMA